MSLRKQAFFLNKERQNMIYILEDDASIKTMLSYAIQKEDETKVTKKEIQDLANSKFGSLQGLAQQYLFYYRRNQEFNVDNNEQVS